MANEFGLISYGDASRREDLIDIIGNISPTDTPFVTGLPVKEAKNTLHEWLTDTLSPRAGNAQPEGAQPTILNTLANPTRVVNITQIIRKDGMVSGTQEEITHAGFNDLMAYQVAKQTKEWKNDLEYASILSTIASGASGTARTMKGMLSFITTNATAMASGTALSETIYNDMLMLAWNAGGSPDEVYVGGSLKRKISDFTAGSTKNVNAADKRLVRAIDVYESDFGMQKIMLCRELNASGAATATMAMLDSQYWALAYLRKPKYQALPDDGGDRSRFKIIGEQTLECHAEAANAKVSGLANS
jgi:hypothetical protein